MLDVLSFASMVYLEHDTGELAGMHNAILKPSYIFGTREEVTFSAFPNLHHALELNGLYGRSLVSGGSTTNPNLLELQTNLSSLYTVYNSHDVLTFNTGPTLKFLHAIHNYPPTINPDTNQEYAEDETETIDREELGGWDFNVAVDYDKSKTSLHNIIYFFGERIGPNLLAYQPAMELGWRQETFLYGTTADPKFSIFVDMNFWFARKANAKFFNSHDGIGGTKRELFISYGLSYYVTPKTSLYVDVHGYNNLNRGSSSTVPKDFRDGATFGVQYNF